MDSRVGPECDATSTVYSREERGNGLVSGVEPVVLSRATAQDNLIKYSPNEGGGQSNSIQLIFKRHQGRD